MSRDAEAWLILSCIAGLTFIAWAHTCLYRKLRDDVEFLMVIVPPVARETEYPS
jgi:hypothetical protein